MKLSPLSLLAVFLLTGCMSAEAQIKQEIADANYCDVAADCVDAGGKCPFDCYIFVNKNEVERIKTMVEGYESKCMYSCLMMKGVECVDHKCTVIQDLPPAADNSADDL